MKIGIITVHRAYNYGSVLQCYALQEYLKSLGHEVWVVDYRQPWTEAIYKAFSLYYVRKNIKHPRIILNYLKDYKKRKKQVKKKKLVFSSFMKKLHLTKSCLYDIPQNFDRYVIGSDQLWSHACFGGEDKIYLGYFHHNPNSKVVGYALSSNVKSLNIFGNEKIQEIVSNFDSLSVREPFIADYIKKNLGINVPVVLDPTLLADASIWENMIIHKWKRKKYIAIYQVRTLKGTPKLLLNKAKILASKMNCDIIDLSVMTYTVEDFISIIKYAQYVITTSFHATVFSLIMETPCYTVKLEDGFDDRYVDLLNAIGAGVGLVEKDFEPTPFHLDFNDVKYRLGNYKKQSINYLNNL